MRAMHSVQGARVAARHATVRHAAMILSALACSGLPAMAQTDAASTADAGKQVFTRGAQPSCAVCHTLSDAGATGNIGPNLDELKPDAARVRRAVKEGIGAMPPLGETLSDAQIDAVAQYVARVSGGG
jgi:cytochrome c6